MACRALRQVACFASVDTAVAAAAYVVAAFQEIQEEAVDESRPGQAQRRWVWVERNGAVDPVAALVEARTGTAVEVVAGAEGRGKDVGGGLAAEFPVVAGRR